MRAGLHSSSPYVRDYPETDADTGVRGLPAAAERKTMLGPARSTGKSLAEQTERQIKIAAYGQKIVQLCKQEDK